MILVAVVAELLEEYTVLVARVLEQLLHGAPFPRRMRFLILRSLPYAAPPLPLPSHAIVELMVHMDCEGCEKRVRKAISKLDGVDTVEIDMDKQKVRVTGYVDKRKVLKAARRTGRKAEFWPYPYDAEYYPFALQYLEDSTYSSTHNYYWHGHNSEIHGYFPDTAYSTIVDDDTADFFNDDNVYACLIM